MYKKFGLFLSLLLPFQLMAANGTIYEHVCQSIVSWQQATNMNARSNETSFYQFSLIGEEEFYKEFKLPMLGEGMMDKCRGVFLREVPHMPSHGMMEVVFKDQIPFQPSRTTSVPVLMLEFTIK